MDAIKRVDNATIRKLPPLWRKLNFGYQILMILLTATNIVLTALDSSEDIHIPAVYFKIFSCVITISFPVWTKILDEAKQYTNNYEDTPTARSPKAAPAPTPIEPITIQSSDTLQDDTNDV